VLRWKCLSILYFEWNSWFVLIQIYFIYIYIYIYIYFCLASIGISLCPIWNLKMCTIQSLVARETNKVIFYYNMLFKLFNYFQEVWLLRRNVAISGQLKTFVVTVIFEISDESIIYHMYEISNIKIVFSYCFLLG